MIDPPSSGQLDGPMHRFAVRVYFEDTDAGGIVYNASYLRFAERARTEMLRLCGFDHQQMIGDRGIALAVRHLEVDFRRAAKLDDSLKVETHVTHVGGASMKLDQLIGRGDEEICHLLVTLVCITLDNGHATRIPADVREAFKIYLDKE
ncbi:tol-pal system-associated acyl-CoA thioesterase [Magnetospira sp. QH-2]|uniref:tol-pal system-associated acyl-CoA thioesterase n=1 Tax=Magnetospira sp. (strain QH-2) TaxID=1288970 RepID=UPI0003E81203|nr:tol-pal system-associated acyl-CoA thioesterase [Magnetospira sp. QH-2]CCQ73313.1 Putative acyl-CoA thioesterase [Magnetospira sp. QH-2]